MSREQQRIYDDIKHVGCAIRHGDYLSAYQYAQDAWLVLKEKPTAYSPVLYNQVRMMRNETYAKSVAQAAQKEFAATLLADQQTWKPTNVSRI